MMMRDLESHPHAFLTSPGAWEEILLQRFGTAFSDRERQVCARRIVGHADQAIADDLVIAKATVKTYTRHICRKIGAVRASEIPICIFIRILKNLAGTEHLHQPKDDA
jgi:DNA-binding CsgD family transcriptional regulator